MAIHIKMSTIDDSSNRLDKLEALAAEILAGLQEASEGIREITDRKQGR